MLQRVYVETSVVSYLASRPSRDIVQLAHQKLTRAWWRTQRPRFEISTSEIVVEEARRGSARAAARRLAILQGLPLLDLDQDSRRLAEKLVAVSAIPKRAGTDALHVAIATVHGMDFLLTWNCRHIANAQMRASIEAACRTLGYEPPALCTPEELMGE